MYIAGGDVQAFFVDGGCGSLGETEKLYFADDAVEVGFVGITGFGQVADEDGTGIVIAQAYDINAAVSGCETEVLGGVDLGGGVS